jgi:hypothetical protein
MKLNFKADFHNINVFEENINQIFLKLRDTLKMEYNNIKSIFIAFLAIYRNDVKIKLDLNKYFDRIYKLISDGEWPTSDNDYKKFGNAIRRNKMDQRKIINFILKKFNWEIERSKIYDNDNIIRVIMLMNIKIFSIKSEDKEILRKIFNGLNEYIHLNIAENSGYIPKINYRILIILIIVLIIGFFYTIVFYLYGSGFIVSFIYYIIFEKRKYSIVNNFKAGFESWYHIIMIIRKKILLNRRV